MYHQKRKKQIYGTYGGGGSMQTVVRGFDRGFAARSFFRGRFAAPGPLRVFYRSAGLSGSASPIPPRRLTPQRGPALFSGGNRQRFPPETPISGCARKDVCGYHAPLIFRRPAFDAACFAAASALAALLLALRSLGPKVLWAHLRRFERLGAADAALVPRLAAQNRSHAGCALAGYPLASSGRRGFADFHQP